MPSRSNKLSTAELQRRDRGDALLNLIEPVPTEWLANRTGLSSPQEKGEGKELDCLPCTEWKVLVASWRKAMKWLEGLDRALSVMLACITSTTLIGDQLWVRVMGPASCGKSTLCEALSVNRQYILAKSTIRGFHSGFKSDAGGQEDNSLVAQLYNKTLVIKDGDTLLQSPNLGMILSEARDLYDSTSRTHYRNRMGRDYQGVRMTWILCGTSSLHFLDQSELGERFLDCVIMDGIDDELETDILWKVAHRADRSMGLESNGKVETQHDPALVQAMRLTGGYIAHLRSRANVLASATPSSDKVLKRCIELGKFVAYMRARPSAKQEETAEREMASRLTSQLVRLAKCLAIVLNRPRVDDAEVMRRVAQVAIDTARGRTLEMAKHLYAAGSAGLEVKRLAICISETDAKTLAILRFLKKIRAVEVFIHQITSGLASRPKWRLTPHVAALYKGVMTEAGEQ